MNISGIILAGGRSNRMGTNKALLKLGELTLIEGVALVMSGVCSEIIIAGGNEKDLEHLGYPIVRDTYPGCGPLSGIHAGLSVAKNRYGFVAACDIPFPDGSLMKKIISSAGEWDAVILQHGEYYEPLFSLYGKHFIKAAEESIKKGVYKVTAALSLVKWKPFAIDAGEIPYIKKSLFNVNTPGDYEEAKKHREQPPAPWKIPRP